MRKASWCFLFFALTLVGHALNPGMAGPRPPAPALPAPNTAADAARFDPSEMSGKPMPIDGSEGSFYPLEKTKVMFMTDVAGNFPSLSIPLEPHVRAIVFTRMPDRAMITRSFLEPLPEVYLLGNITNTVTLEGEKTLYLIVPGQPTYELVPRRGTTFYLKGLFGFSIEFTKDDSGTVTEAVFYQPEGTYLAKRK